MGLTKSEIFTPKQNDLAKIAKVLGHPARIAILQYLFKINSCVCGDLVNEIGLAQPTISQHLKELKNYLSTKYPNLQKHFNQEILRFAVNQEYVVENIILNEDDEIAVFPPVSGG